MAPFRAPRNVCGVKGKLSSSDVTIADGDADATPGSSPDRRLVERLRDGDVAALTELMRIYTAPLIRFAYDIVGFPDAAEDLVQGIFIHVWTARATLDPARSIKAYLYRAAQNRALNERKAEEVRVRHRQQMPTVISNPESRIVDATTVQAAMAQLGPRRRLALRLRFEEGMTHTEIAEVLGISPEAAKRLVSRAVAEIRILLAPYYK